MVALQGDGKTARFVPTANFTGLAGFPFTVIDSQGGSLTNAIGLHVLIPPTPAQLNARLANGSPVLDLFRNGRRSLQDPVLHRPDELDGLDELHRVRRVAIISRAWRNRAGATFLSRDFLLAPASLPRTEEGPAFSFDQQPSVCFCHNLLVCCFPILYSHPPLKSHCALRLPRSTIDS
jgi:hypothetical protein